jgi:UDP-3-O-[3-hydroxymyristoyl] glucosamine N-acyltransferase
MTARELAQELGADLVGDPAAEIRSVNTLDRAGPGEVAFLSNAKYRPLLETTRAAAVIVRPEDRAQGPCLLLTPNPYLAFARAVTLLQPEHRPPPGVEAGCHVHPTAELESRVTAMAGSYLDEGARIGAGTVLYPGAYVGRGARVGRDCVLYANVTVREGCVLGDRVVLQPGVVVGSDGYGYARDGHRHVKIPQIGIAVIEDDVEVGAGTTIDRAALGETRIGRGTKIDNLVQIGHNVTLGEDCLVVAQVGVSGSTQIGDRVILAGQVGVVGHIKIGDGCVVAARSGVPSDLPPGAVVSGSPARDHAEWLKTQAVVRRLPKLRQQIQQLEKRLNELESRAHDPGRGGGVEDDQ